MFIEWLKEWIKDNFAWKGDMNMMEIFISHIILKTIEGLLKFYRRLENVV